MAASFFDEGKMSSQDPETTSTTEGGGGDTDSSSPAVCGSTADELVDHHPRTPLYEPRAVQPRDSRIEIRAKRENPDVIPWGFWGGVLAALVAGFVLFSGAFTGPATRFGFTDALVVSVLLMVGLVLFRLGRRSTLEEMVLCEIDTEHRLICWPTDGEAVAPAVAFADVRQLTFALVDAPVHEHNADAHIEAARVCIHDDRGRKLPVIDGSTSKGRAHRIARMLAEMVGVSVDYVGTGVGEWADRSDGPT